MLQPVARVQLRVTPIAEALLEGGREEGGQGHVQLELIEQLGLQVGRVGEAPCGRIGVGDGDDVIGAAFDRQVGGDGVGRIEVLDVQRRWECGPWVAMSYVPVAN